jgi:hypothetical protein
LSNFKKEVLLMLRAPSLAMTLLVLLGGYATAAAPPDLGANAALKYWQAFATLPKLTDTDQTRLVTESVTMPLDASARELVAKASYSLRLMHQGARLPHCDWGLGWEEEGVALLLPQGNGARVLSSLACLRARMRFEAGEAPSAIEDILAAMTLGRHLARDGLNILVLVDYGIDQRASEVLARYLPQLDSRMIQDLKKHLDTLPSGGSPATSMKFEEKCALDWLVRRAKKAPGKENLLALANEYGEGPEKSRAFLEACGGNAEGVIRFAEQTRPSYRLMEKALDLPLAQFEQEWARENARQSGNPVFKLVFPAYDQLRWQQARAEVRRSLLAAAIAVRLKGPGALKEHPDPLAAGPFAYTPFEGGFELRSTFKMDDSLRAKLRLDERSLQPLVLPVGRRGP